MRYINIHVNQHLFLDALHANRFSHLKLKELSQAPSPGKCFQFKSKSAAVNFINALVAFAQDYPALTSDAKGLKWVYDLGNHSGFKIDFPTYRY